jgi:hypothetical protein
VLFNGTRYISIAEKRGVEHDRERKRGCDPAFPT